MATDGSGGQAHRFGDGWTEAKLGVITGYLKSYTIRSLAPRTGTTSSTKLQRQKAFLVI